MNKKMDNTNHYHIREQQRKSWNTFAPGWKKWDSFMMKKLEDVGLELLDACRLKEGCYVLDVATGTGEPGLTAAKRVGNGKVIGTDLSENMIQIANENAKARGIRNYEARVMDATNLAFDDNSFDAVICRFGIMFFPEPELAIGEMARVVKQDGIVALSSWAEPSKNPWITVISGVVNKMLDIPKPSKDAPGLFRFSNASDLKLLFENAGLNNAEVKEVKGESTFESTEQYWQVMTEVAAPIAQALNKASNEQREEIKKAVIEAAKQYDKDGKAVFGYGAWVASCMK